MSEWASVHQPCPCGKSSDAFSINTNGWGTCFSCNETFPPGETTPVTTDTKSEKRLVPFGRYQPLVKRGITEETCRKYGYFIGEVDGDLVQVAPYQDTSGKLVGQKLRFPGKRFITTGDFSNVSLFGRHLWRTGGKRVVITEGEIDCLAAAQAMNLSWAVVSLPSGASGYRKAIQRDLEWLESYDTVVLCFDMDEPGQDAAREAVNLFSPGKVAIAKLPLKDAGEMVQAGREAELRTALWEAQVYRPDGILNGADLRAKVLEPVVMGTPYPWEGLNHLLYGMRPTELVTWTAGTGTGKTAIVSEVAYHLGNALQRPIGCVYLEEGVGRSGQRLVGIHLNKPLHLPGHGVSDKEIEAAFDATLGSGRYTFYDHFGSLDGENLMSKLRYMVKGVGVKHLILDHISIVVSGMDERDNERKTIDRLMTTLRSFSQETGVQIHLISHLSRPEGKGHEEGAHITLKHLRGSGAIAQLSDAVIAAERNQQHPDPNMRNTTFLRVLKNRYAGFTGLAQALQYDPVTGRLSPVDFFVDEDGSVSLDPTQGGPSAFTSVREDDLPF